jgi:hypothetical protein
VRKVVTYSFGAIALYLAFAYATSAGNIIGSAASGSVNVIKAFQGR